ncbi:hypothetical protein PRUPE_6G165600 [Prunus persica]|uniref:Protein kinase domain-containing protein n=1 Tax=Prunus persica TaxID=3760 RepID=A0A251NRF7_PRUPE|nr:hypothetical protein PRUPE_6G165600 [Prunus persica]
MPMNSTCRWERKREETVGAEVWKAVHRESGEVVALKQVFLSRLNRRLKNCLDCEIKFLSSVCHPNIVRLLKAFQNEGCIFLVLEFCNGGNLAAYIRQHGRVQEQIARKFMQQLGAGLEILHSHHIIHRDLKPEDILLSLSDDDVVVKVISVSQAIKYGSFIFCLFFSTMDRSLHPGDYAETVCGSPLYMAPEVLQFERYDGKVLKNIKSSTCPPFDQLILSRLHPDSVDMCSKLLSQNPVYCPCEDKVKVYSFGFVVLAIGTMNLVVGKQYGRLSVLFKVKEEHER